MNNSLEWIETGRRFGFDDLVFWHGKSTKPFAAVAKDIDTIVFGPHASAGFPMELRPFVSEGLTRRKQFDYSDVITSALGQSWAQADPHVAYVENPHSRLVLDPNRPPVDDIEPGLRKFFANLKRQREGDAVSFAGIDSVRPITFAGEDVLREPATEDGWPPLIAALKDCALRGAMTYARIRDALVEDVIAARPKGARVLVVSLHDTMNTQVGRDGAIVRERPPSDRLPWLVNLGNRGDTLGEGPADELSIPAAEMRLLADALAHAWKIPPLEREAAILLNKPYKGAFETMHWGQLLRSRNAEKSGVVQAEFLRETLLGPEATKTLCAPGDDWPPVDARHIAAIADRLKTAGDFLRARK